MKFYYDLHIHSCLSPCAEDDMTPGNIAGMAKLIGLDVIAITDHNCCLNCRAVAEASKLIAGPLVLPGMELETSENVHMVILFPDFDSAERASEEVGKTLFRIDNRPDIYGNQIICDSFDKERGRLEQLLVVSSQLGVYDAVAFAQKYGGVAYPAHIDRPSNGILGILGNIDEDMGFSAVEFSATAPEELKSEYFNRGYTILSDSDSHNLGSLSDRINYLELDRLSAEDVIKAIKFIRSKK